MDFKEWLTLNEKVETVTDSSGYAIKVWVNPSYAELELAFSKMKSGKLRAMLDNGAWYVWDAYDMIHESMKRNLGVMHSIDLYLFKNLTFNLSEYEEGEHSTDIIEDDPLFQSWQNDAFKKVA